METKVMGVLRLAPNESAADGRSLARALVTSGRRMISEGADIVEICCTPCNPGRPAATPAAMQQLVSVVGALAGDVRVAVATGSPELAAAATGAGATLIGDPATAPVGGSLPAVAAAAGAGWVAVHDAGAPSPRHPRAPGNRSGGRHHLDEMIEALSARVEQARTAGVEEIYLDPGIGKGRGTDDDLDLLGSLEGLSELGVPLVVGTGDGAAAPGVSGSESDRLERVLVVAVWAMLAGAAIIRTHHVAATVEAARVVGAKPPVGQS